MGRPNDASVHTRRGPIVAAGLAPALGLVMAIAWSAAAPAAPGVGRRAATHAAHERRASRPDMPGPAHGAPGRGRLSPTRLLANADCVGCHPTQADDWSRSLHRHAFDNPVFTQAFERNRDPFCQSCHAPESDPRTPVTDTEASVGVGCVTCHGTGESILAAPVPEGATPTDPPHGVVRDPGFASTGACAACHQFEFPNREDRPRRERMQRTIEEHAASAFADRSCADCHMPWRATASGRVRSHDFTVMGDVELLRGSIDVVASRPEPGSLVFALTTADVGHAVPTGDLFRRLVVRTRTAAADEWRDEAYLGREFRWTTPLGKPIFTQSRDRRVGIGSDPRVVELALPKGNRDRPVQWRVVFQRIAHAEAGRPRKANVADEWVLYEGTLAPPAQPGTNR